MKYSRLLAVLTFILFAIEAGAQPNIDSLEKVLPNMKEDTNKIKAMAAIAMSNRDIHPKLAIKQASEALELSNRLKSKTGQAMMHNILGVCYRNISKYPEALEHMFRSLKLCEELNDEPRVAKTLGNIGGVYRGIKNLDKAMEYYTKAYQMCKKVGNSIGMTNNLSDMGTVCSERNDVNGAMEYLNRALENAESTGDKEGVAIVLGNIANVYSQDKNADKAVENFEKSLSINRELNRMQGIVTNMMNLASLHYQIAVDSIKPGLNNSIIPRGKEANLAKAIRYYSESIRIYQAVSHLDGLFQAHKGLAAAYSAGGDNKKAFEALETAVKLNDSIRSTDDNVKLAQLGEERAEREKRQQEELTKLAQNKRRNEAVFFSIGIALLIVAVVFIARARRKSDKLLLNILPAEVAKELKGTGTTMAKYYSEVTVVFTDFVNFTALAERLTPQALVDELHTCFKAFDEIVTRHKIEKIKTVGDAYLAVSGLPAANPKHAESVIAAALEINAFIRQRKAQVGVNAFEIRIGINSGSVVAGIVGVKKFAYNIWGDTVNTAARMEQTSEPGKINVSQATYELVRGKYKFTHRGDHEVKNKGMMEMYFVEG